jgi:hypothetical protein
LKKNILENYLLSISIVLIVLYGFYLCFIGGYGSDEDTLPMIYVFESKLFDGRFVSSRFTSYPIPEIGIGFLSYFFGSYAASSITFIFHLIGLILIFFSFENKFNLQKLNLFLILSLSSPVLFFDNLEPIDYSWAFLFFSIGMFFYSRRIFEIAILAFAFSVGCRLNFIIFVLVAIFFFNNSNLINYKKRIILFVCTFIISGLFYLPVWFDNGFGLNWITAARPVEQGIFGLLARFSYKTWLAFGLLQTFLILFIFYKTFKSNIKVEAYRFLFLLIISNLLLFLYIPAELSYLQPAIIATYLIVIQTYKKKLILILIFLNFVSWGTNLQILKINYKDNSLCAPKQAISASLDFKFIKGAIYNYFDTRKMINCWIDDSTERGKRILKGQSTRKP